MKMKLFLLLMFGGLCRADLLNRGYLPPPGAKTSGGSDGAVDLPLETPFETPRRDPQRKPIQGSFSGHYRPEDPNVYRTSTSGSNQDDNFTAGTQQPESVNIPMTTTSFAFTQTTTFSPLNGEDCKEQRCMSNQYTASSLPISQEQSFQQIPFGQQPQDSARGSIPQFQSHGLDLTTQLPFSSQPYGNPNQDRQTFTTVGSQAPSIQPFSPVPSSGKSPPTLNNGYLPEGTETSSQFQVAQKNYGNHGSGESTPPKFPQDQSLSTSAATTQAPMGSFTRPEFGRPSQYSGAHGTGQYSPISTAGNVPANIGLHGSQSHIPSSSSSQYPYEETFGKQAETSTGLHNGPINGNTNVISGTSPGILPTGKPNQFPSVSLPVTSSVVGSNSFPSTDSPLQNQPIFGQRPRISSELPNVLTPGINSGIPGVSPGVLQTAGPSEYPSVSPNVFPSVTSGSISSSTPVPHPNELRFGQLPGVSSAFSKVLPSASVTIPGSGRIPSDGPSRFPSVLPSGAGGVSNLTPNVPSQTADIQQTQRYFRPTATLDTNATILRYDSIITPEGYFSYNFDTSNGIHADETGDASDGVKAEGSFSYTGDDGQFYSVTYTADENGYQPKGDHLPTPPPIPEAIQRVIEKSARDKAAGKIPDQGFYDESKYGYKKYEGKPGQDTSFQTLSSSGVESENVYNRRPVAPGRRPSSSEISHNLPSRPYDPTLEDETFSQTTLRPNYESKYEPIDQGVNRKVTSHKPPKYLPEPSTGQYPEPTSFHYTPQGITSESDEIRGEMKPGYMQGQSSLLIDSSNQAGLRVPGDESFAIKKIQNISGSPTTISPNIFAGTRTTAQNIGPYGEKYNQFGQHISNTLPTQNVPGSVSIKQPTASLPPYERPLDNINMPVTSEGKILDRKDQIYDQFTQVNEPSGFGGNLPSNQNKYTKVQDILGTQTPISHDYTVPVEVKYEDVVYKDKSNMTPGTSTFSTIRPTTYSTNGETRGTSTPEIVPIEGYTTKPIYNKQDEFYQIGRDYVNRPITASEGQAYSENSAPGSYADFPQRQQTNAIARPYDRDMTKQNGYKYNVPSQRFDYGITQKPQQGKFPSFAKGPTVEVTSENFESGSTIAPEIISTSGDFYPSSPEVDGTGITERPLKKPGRPSPGSVELFSVTPDTFDSTIVGTDFVTRKPFDGTISTSKPLMSSRGSTRYKTVPSRIETSTSIPGQPQYKESSPLTNTQERLNFESRPKGIQPSQPTTTAHPSRFASIQSQFTTSKPGYNNQITYSQNEIQPMTPFGKPQERPSAKQSVPGDLFMPEEEGIYGPAPTISGSSDFVQAQPSTPKPFQLPQRGYPGAQFQPPTSRLDGGLPKDYSQGSPHPSTIRPFGTEFMSRMPTHPTVSGYPTTQQTSYTATGPVQYNTSRPDYTEQSILGPEINGQTYPEPQEIDRRPMDVGRKDQGFVGEPTRQFGVQPKLDQFGAVQQSPGHFEQQKSNMFLLDQPRPGQSVQEKPGQFEARQQPSSQFELRRPGQNTSDVLKPDEFKQRKPDQFGTDHRGTGPFMMDQQRPGFLSEKQRQFILDRQQPGQFGFDQQKPSQLGLDQQNLDQSDKDQRQPGSFALNQQRPGQLTLEQQKPIQFGSGQQQPNQFGIGQQRPTGSQQPGQFGTDHQRPVQFGTNGSSFPKVKGEVFSPSRKPPSYDPETGYHY